MQIAIEYEKEQLKEITLQISHREKDLKSK